eukprot:10638948-Alexandrium_andersonii.AAC.1
MEITLRTLVDSLAQGRARPGMGARPGGNPARRSVSPSICCSGSTAPDERPPSSLRCEHGASDAGT